LYPPKINDNRSCILCGQSFKSCTHDNIAIQKQKFADGFANIKLKWAEIAFFIIVSSFVVYEILSEWSVSKEIVMTVPNWINHSLNLSGNLTGTVKALVLFVVLPSVFYLIFVLAKKLLAGESYKSGFSQLVLAFLPITASIHLLKALLKTTSRIPYWNYVFADPNGVETATRILHDKSMLQNGLLESFISPTIGIIAILLAVLGLTLSLYLSRKQNHKNSLSRVFSIIAIVFYSGVFLITLIAWKIF
jgi:hypothetical protein